MAKQKRILVVEDDLPIARTLALKLKKALYEVDMANDGERALECLASGHCDLVLLDLIMPKMDGFAVLEALQKKSRMPPVIVLSNLGQEEDKQRALALGATGYFIKSDTTLAEIVEEVKRMI